MLLGRASSTAAAIATGLAAQQNNNIASCRTLTTHSTAGCSTHNAANFHTLSYEFIMIVFLNMTGCQANLVTIGAVASSSADSNLALGQLTGQGFAHGSARVSAAGNTHCLVYIGATGKRIANSTAKAGGSAAEGLDFGGMVMGFVLEHNQPVLSLAIHFDGHHDGASIDFLGLVQIVQLALLAQLLHPDNGNIHQCYRALGVFAINSVASSHIFIISLLYGLSEGAGNNVHILNLRHKGGVTAVVGPIGIQHANFRNSGLTMLFIEVFLAPQQVLQAHSQTHFLAQCFSLVLGHSKEACYGLNLFRLLTGANQCFGLSLLSFTRFDGVDAICFNFSNIISAQLALQYIYLRSSHHGTLLLGNQLNALLGKILALVVLTGQQLHSKGHFASCQLQMLLHNAIHRRLGQHQSLGHSEFLVAQAHNIITINNADILKSAHAQIIAQIGKQAMRFNGKGVLLLHIDSSDTTHIHSLQSNNRIVFRGDYLQFRIYFNTFWRFVQYIVDNIRSLSNILRIFN